MNEGKILTDFFIGGAPKCGTTSIWQYLSDHPEIYMGEEKEIYFFTHKWKKGVDWYNHKFRYYDGEKIVGDGSINLLVSRKAPSRIQALIEHPKFIFIFRNPLDRLISDYRWTLQQGRPPAKGNSFSEYLEKIKSPNSYRLNFGMYYKNLTRFEDIFGSERVKTVFFEDIKLSTEKTIKNIYNFLGVSDTYKPKINTYNKSKNVRNSRLVSMGYKVIEAIESALGSSMKSEFTTAVRTALQQSPKQGPRVSTSDKEFLFNYYKDDIRSLEEHLDKDLSSWISSVRPDELS